VVKPIQEVSPDGPVVLPSAVTEIESEGTVERDLVSQAEEEDMEALLGTYVLFFYLLLFIFLYGFVIIHHNNHRVYAFHAPEFCTKHVQLLRLRNTTFTPATAIVL
jgi:hypothetical protein